MPIRLGAQQNALLEAGVSPATATKAAEELDTYERDIAGIKSDLNALKVGSALTLALLVALTVKTFFH